MCELCQVTETISNLFYECPEAATIWNRLSTWLTNAANLAVHFDKKSILIGSSNNEPIVNNLILVTKNEIYKKKWKGTNINLNYLKKVFQNHMKVDLYIGTIKNTLPKMLGKWSNLHQLLSNLV